MPVVETQIQHREVMPFFCNSEENGGLGYRRTEPNIINEQLFIPSHLEEFISQADPMAWRSLMSKHHQDKNELLDGLCAFIYDRILSSQNVATFFNNNKTITFEGEQLHLFYVSGTEITGNTDFSRNIFAVAEEVPYNVVCDGITLQRLRPDVVLFLNGIFLGYIELKSVTNGQTARDNGRGKVIADYLESIKGLADREHYHAQAINDRKSTLYMFEKGIHIVATDINETYVMRNIATFFDDAHRDFYDKTKSVKDIRPALEKMFKIYPISSESLSNTERFKEVMTALYSKRMIEKEILYYNFTQFKYAGSANKKERINHHGYLVCPRPKQKFGCDKIMNRVKEMLDHELEPEYYNDILRRQLRDLYVTPERIEEIVAERNLYCNNRYVYSLLMQYAAGFGKSNIIGWTALQLKDLRHNGQWAYDKIMIVVDRLQLRDQLDTMMLSMNIDKSMFVEVTDQDTFIKALTGTKRIVVVNIQKFLELQNALDRAGKTLQKMRVAFLIDEIHRSNTGENNKEMVNLFEKLQDSFNTQAQNGGEIKKKNLIVGFTATPTDKVLARFGEFKSAQIIPTWVPFDAYTMKEAIADGYILDPTKHIIPVPVKMHFDLPEEFDPDNENQDITLPKDLIYSNPERIAMISQFIVDRLTSLVYNKIHGAGKAMLAVSSIPIAIDYYRLISGFMASKCQLPAFNRYKDAPVSIVYSDNQDYESCTSLNNYVSEEKVIQNFRLAKNGLMIVVDKLQTGFDEPKLHTLFLDKEINGINAIQTISRVNRTCKYKEECHIVDLSWKSVNVDNIHEAFLKYCGITTSNFNPEQEVIELEHLYKDLCNSEPHVKWYKDYCRNNNDTSFMLRMEDGIRQWIRIQFERTAINDQREVTDDDYIQVVNEAKVLRRKIGEYGAALNNLEDILDVEPKYKLCIFLKFWEIYCRIYRECVIGLNPNADILNPDVEVGDEYPGITVADDLPDIPEEEPEEPRTPKGGNDNQPRTKEKTKEDILQIIRRWNENEELTAEVVKKWITEIGLLFEALRNNEDFMVVLKDRTFNEEIKHTQYVRALNRYKRGISLRSDVEKVEQFKRLLTDNSDQLYEIFKECVEGDIQMHFDF